VSDLDAVITALAARIVTGMGSDAIAGRTYAYGKDSVDPPACLVLPAPGEFLVYDDTMSATSGYNLVVKILMGSQDDRSGQAALMGYLDRTGSTSIRAAIYGDQTLGGTCSFCRVTGASDYNDVEWAGQVFYGATLNVEVLT
jgi:hypothetical protein